MLIKVMLKRIQFIFFFILISFAQIIHIQSEELNLDQLLQKLDSIESRIKVLEKATFSKTTSGTGNNVSLDDYQSIITKQSIQIAELQNEVQSLTAKIEEMIFTMQSTVNNFNTFREDTEFRFIDINSKTESIEKNQLSMTLPNNETQTNNLVDNTSEGINLEPQSLGTINVSSEEEISASPFEIKNVDEDEEQEIINTISQDNIVSFEEQEIVLAVLPEGDEKGQYEYAMGLLKQGDYELAEKAFQEFMAVGNDFSLLSNANFWLAETYYVRENYKDAAKNYLNLYQVYPDSKKAADALLKLGISLVNMDQKEQGCVTFIQLKDTYPNANTAVLDRGKLEIEKNGCEIS